MSVPSPADDGISTGALIYNTEMGQGIAVLF